MKNDATTTPITDHEENIMTTKLTSTTTLLASGPRDVETHDTVNLEFFLPVPADLKFEPHLNLGVTISSVDFTPGNVTLKIVATVAAAGADTKLTRLQYRSKRKGLKAALDAGALTDDEYDKYDAALVECIQ